MLLWIFRSAVAAEELVEPLDARKTSDQFSVDLLTPDDRDSEEGLEQRALDDFWPVTWHRGRLRASQPASLGLNLFE